MRESSSVWAHRRSRRPLFSPSVPAAAYVGSGSHDTAALPTSFATSSCHARSLKSAPREFPTLPCTKSQTHVTAERRSKDDDVSRGRARAPQFWGIFHVIIWIHRYLRLLVHCVSHWTYKSKVPNWEKPRYTADDITVIIPTIHNRPEELRPSLESILACKPAKLILVTTYNKHEALSRVAATLRISDEESPVEIEVLHVDKANKRLQVCKALEGDYVRTAITVMADDDVEWPPTLIPWLLAPFEDDRIGGVGTCQRVKRVTEGDMMTRIWNWLGAAYIERRNFEISATHNIDGGTSCMSGRTGAYRSEILKSYDFLANFKNEKWGRYILNADDDNFVTRWLVAHQWKTWIQYEPECEIETTLENSFKFLYQCSRWARSNWRSNWTSLVVERHVITQQPWCTYALHIATFTSLAFVVDPLLLFSCWWGTENWELRQRYIEIGWVVPQKPQ
ncbi:hypothetical protein VTJ49DRAFT_6593 [Mycothermus thermophilus]|uniref:Glycosyltransferase family 2 protein n=1 Tax=Humicola insolens TaxID=85995 RepID=A0ABR3V1L5_HUMIN